MIPLSYTKLTDTKDNTLAEQTIQQNELTMDDCQKDQIASFDDELGQNLIKVPYQMDKTVKAVELTDSELGEWLSREVLLYDYEDVTSITTVKVKDVWSDFLKTAAVVDKISNYNLIRGTLKVRFQLNGNQFFAGRIFAYYSPYGSSPTINGVSVKENFVVGSQRQNILLNPTTSTGGCLCVPYFFNTPYMNVTTGLGFFESLGKLSIGILNAIVDTGNNPNAKVSMRIYASMEDVALTVPTDALPQSNVKYRSKKKNKDEYQEDDIKPSAVATAIATAAGALSAVPVIGPFATATSIAAGAGSQILKLFGLSRPVQLVETTNMRPGNYDDLSTYLGSDTVFKLTVDPKQELTMDPMTVGLPPIDEMSLKRFITQESYIGTFEWPETAATDDLLYSFRVNPNVNSSFMINSITGGHRILQSSLAYAAQAFRYWRGTIIFRFEIVCSNFTKGRLSLNWDPIANTQNGATMNTHYTKYVSIDNTCDFEVEIGWGQPIDMQRVDKNLLVVHSSSTPAGVLADFNNGILNVNVATRLVSNSTDPVDINVYVRGGEDMRFMDPALDENDQYPSVYAPQGLMTVGDNYSKPEELMTQGTTKSDLMQIKYTPKEHSLVNGGEEITHIRQLMHRYGRWFSKGLQGSDQGNVNSLYMIKTTIPHFGMWYGYTTSINNNTSLAAGQAGTGFLPMNYTRDTYFHYFAPAYAGMRGSTRIKTANLNANNMVEIRHVRDRSNVYDYNTLQYSPGINNSDRSAATFSQFYGQTNAGQAATLTRQQPTLGSEHPYYSPYRFTPVNEYIHLGDTTFTGSTRTIHLFEQETGAQDDARLTNFEFSIGEDLQLLYFVGAPVKYVYTSFPGEPA